MLAAADSIVSKALVAMSTSDWSDLSLGIYWNVTILATFGKDIWESFRK